MMYSPDKLALMSAKLRENAEMLAEMVNVCRVQAEEACGCSGNGELEEVGRALQAVSDRLSGEIEALLQCSDRVRKVDEAYRQADIEVMADLMNQFG